MKLLLIARHHSAPMHRKAELLATAHGATVSYAIPAEWRDSLTRLRPSQRPAIAHRAYRFIGAVDDPHRATWRTLDFGMRAFVPDVVLAEEEPDSIAAAHVALARRIFAPRARLVLYTWQNVARAMSGPARAIRNFALRAAQGVICANADAEALLRTLGYARPMARILAIGIDTATFAPCDSGTAEAVTPFVIGFAGRLLVEKSLDTLLHAAARLPDVHVRLIGDGPQRQSLMDLADSLGISKRVVIAGSVAPAEMRAALCGLNALVLPSQSMPHWKEQFGRVLVEAMACGVPVIGSDSGAIPEVIGDAGLIFPERDVAALAAAVARLASSADLQRTLRDRGLARVRANYTQERVAERYAEFLSGFVKP